MHALTSSHTTMLTSTRSSTLTSSVVPSAVCSVAPWAEFLTLRGFPPAEEWCSGLLSPHPTALPTPTCPNGNAVCAVLSILESAESSSASTACSCIGTGSISTVSVSITSTPQVSSTLKTTSPITSSVTPKTTAKVASTISATSKVNSLTTRATSSATTAAGTLSTTATSAAPTPSPPVLTPLCPAVSENGEVFSQYFAGSLVVENTNNYGNDNPYDFPPVYRSFPGTLDMCDAANECLEQAEDQLDGYLSFDLHFLGSNETWECVLYSDPNTDASAFNVSDPDALATFGFSA